MGLIISEIAENIGTITINRPDDYNALNSEVLGELDAAFSAMMENDEVRVIILTGAGKAFVAGADVAEMMDMTVAQARAFGNKGQQLFRKIERCEKPTIAAVNGYALGGGMELAMACDIRMASEYAAFGQPETGLGITPGFSGTQRLARLVGKGIAAELILTAENISAQRAEQIGLVNHVVAADKLMEETRVLAAKIAKKPPLAVRYANGAIKRGLETDIDTGISLEADVFALCFSTEEQSQLMHAMVEGFNARHGRS